MSKAYEFLKECGSFFVLTLNGDYPADRPFYFGLAFAFLVFLLCTELWGNMSMGFPDNGNVLLAVILGVEVLIMYAGLLLAKITHIIAKAIQRRHDK